MKEISNNLSIQKLLQEQLRTGGLHTLFLTKPEHVGQYPFVLWKVDLASQKLSIKIAEDEHEELLRDLMGGEKVKVFLNDVGITFISEILGLKSGSSCLEIALPEVVFFEDRRKEERFRPEGFLKVHFPPQKNHPRELIKDILDISKGGLSFLLSREDRFRFEIGEEIKLSVLIGKDPVYLYAHLVKILKIKPFVLENIPYGDRLVSLSFTDRDEMTLKRFQNFIESFFTKG